MAVAACGVGTSAGAAAAGPLAEPATTSQALPFPAPPLPPELDPGFYQPPHSVVSSTEPGGIIAARRVNLAYASVLPINIDAWQLSFRSNNTRDEPIVGITTVMSPRTQPGAEKHLLSYQFAEDSLGQYCRPSYLSQFGSAGPLAGSAETTSQFAVPIAAAQLGWTVAIPDHQGPNQAFGAGPLEGRITLDGIRAAENFEPLGLSRATKVGMTGYSGGAIASGHAAEQHASYAPDINIVGVAQGGVPADVGAMLRMASGNAGAGIISSGALGATREYPELAKFFDEHLTPAGRAYFSAKDNLCQIPAALVVPFVDQRALFDIPDFFTHPTIVKAFEKLKMGRTVPDMPMFIFQSNPDWLVPVGVVNELVDTYCADPNAQVQYVRDHFSEHLTLDLFGAPLQIKYLKDRFAGVPAPTGCHTTDAGTVLADPNLWATLLPELGPTVLNLLGKPVGT